MKVLWILYIGIFVCAFKQTYSQGNIIHSKARNDSIIRALPNISAERSEVLFGDLNWEMLYRSHQELSIILPGLIQIAESGVNSRIRLICYINLGEFYGKLDSIATAYRWFQKSIALAESESDSNMLALSYMHLSYFQDRHGLYEDAAANGFIAIDIAKRIHEPVKLYKTLDHILNVYVHSQNFKSASLAGQQMLQVYRDMNDSSKNLIDIRFLMHSYDNLGLAYRSLEENDSAYSYFDLSDKIAIDVNDKPWRARVLINKGDMDLKSGRVERALQNLLYGARESQTYEMWPNTIAAMILLSEIHRERGDLKTASTYLDSSNAISRKYLSGEMPTNYWVSYADLQFAKGNYKLAWEAQKRYMQQNAADVKRQTKADLLKVQSAHDLKSKQVEIDNLVQNATIRDTQLQSQRYGLIAAGVALIFLALFTVNSVANFRRQKKANATIKRHQDKLVQTEKMAFLGRLTSGIAHEVNTPLGAIKASAQNVQARFLEIRKKIGLVTSFLQREDASLFLELVSQQRAPEADLPFAARRERKKACIQALKELNVEDPNALVEYVLNAGVQNNYERWAPLLKHPNAYELFKLIDESISVELQVANIVLAVSKASKILFALKTYSHTETDAHEIDVNLVDNIEIILSIYGHNLSQTEVVRHFETVPLIKGYPEELSQVWTNVIYNSLQAMSGAGKLRINVASDDPDHVKVEIIDNGIGISQENQKRLFEPFFTTKAVGEGTGLGLSIVKRIIDKHNGTVQCESEVGKGTIFRFVFPVS